MMRAVSVRDLVTPFVLMTGGVLVGLFGIIFGLFSSVGESISRDALTFATIGMGAVLLMRTGLHYASARRGASKEGEEWAYAIANAFRDVRSWIPAVLFGIMIAFMRHWSLA